MNTRNAIIIITWFKSLMLTISFCNRTFYKVLIIYNVLYKNNCKIILILWFWINWIKIKFLKFTFLDF